MKRKSQKKIVPVTPAIAHQNSEWSNLVRDTFVDLFAKINTSLSSQEMNILKCMVSDALVESKQSAKDFYLKYGAAYLEQDKSHHEIDPNNKDILFVTGIFPSVEHGGGLRVFDMIEELHRQGYRVSLFSPEPTKRESACRKNISKFLTNVHYAKPGLLNKHSLDTWLEKNDVVYRSAYFVWPWISLLIDNKSKYIQKNIFEFIEVTARRVWMDLEILIKNQNYEKIPLKLIEFWDCFHFELAGILKSESTVCLTEKDAEFVKQLFGKETSVIVPTGLSRSVILDKVSKNAIPAADTVGFLGNYFHYPNLDGIDWYLQNVHPHVLERHPQYKLEVMGIGDLAPLKKKYSNYKKSVRWVGEIDEVVSALQTCEICICPLINGAGLRGKINQYAAVRRPIVTTTIGACGTPYVHGKSVFIADEPRKFAEFVDQLLSDKSLAQRLVKSADKVVHDNFTWASSLKILQTIL